MTVSNLLTLQSQLLNVIEPVLELMPAGVLKQALVDAFRSQESELLDIESTFQTLTSRRHAAPQLRKFFGSWSKTNNSAASVSGLANRITLLARSEQWGEAAQRLYRICSNLQRITDEDLGALSNTLHSELFYNMATRICGDDQWLLIDNCLPSAQAFKDWTDAQRLRDRDLLQGLLVTLVHEVYTHGEVEFIHPLFKQWFERDIGVPPAKVRATVAWVTVHTGGTESNHFAHAVAAVEEFVDVMGIVVVKSAAQEIFGQYLQRKAAVMRECGQYLG
ncbi:hypothetical protein SAMN04490179_2094 [Pseudomonas antarctica]|uniref:Uncharacterized protein n=1 Tax=Pseudomonas antarctica TaxID=219572 RepID=A0A1G9Y0G6_9PSED|nr:hypothetical protein PSAN_26950 [Pseudomonas antarctica]SDN02141.1 hypothetical protein SAMN04490179_2094 [Pseudomonas antarctica]